MMFTPPARSVCFHFALIVIIAWAPLTAFAIDPDPKAVAEAPPPAIVSDEDLKKLNDRDLIVVNPIIITASGYEEEVFSSPFMANQINDREIRQRGYRTLPEALQYVPGVMVQKTGHGQGSPFIRGFTGFRTLMLVDGIRLNNSANREGPNQYWATVDLYSIDRLEVVKGPSSVLHGSDAIGGTVNAITKSPIGYGPGIHVNTNVYIRAASAEESFTIRGETSITIDEQFGFLLGTTGKWYGDLRSGGGDQPDTGYDDWAGDAKGEWFINPDTRLVLAYQRVQQNNVPRTHSTVFAVPFAGTSTGSDLQRDLDQDRELLYAQIHAVNITGAFFDTLRAGVSWHHQYESEHRIVSNRSHRIASFDVNTFGLFLNLESETPIGRLAYGIEFYHDSVNSAERRSNETAPRIQGPVGDNASYDLLGIYIQDTIKPHEIIDLIIGGRFTYARAEANRVHDPSKNPRTSTPLMLEDDYTSFVGSLRGVIHVVPETVNLFGGVSQGFRAPNLSDLSASRSAASGTFESSALGLDPEHYITFEAGVKVKHETFGGQASYFYTIIDDMIVRGPTGATTGGTPDETIVRAVNAGDGYVHGVELEAYWIFFDNFTLFGNFTWMEGQVDTFLNVTDPTSLMRRPLSRVQPMTGLIGLRYDEPDRKWWIETTVALADNQDQLAPGDVSDTQRIPAGGTPGYVIWSIRGGVKVCKDFTLFVGVDNITDENYRVHGSGVNGPGRNFILGGEFKF
ncbi:MAG: TonB-dependent receptor [Phycisphaeraceae bacterium]